MVKVWIVTNYRDREDRCPPEMLIAGVFSSEAQANAYVATKTQRADRMRAYFPASQGRSARDWFEIELFAVDALSGEANDANR